ncbi:hypothetical protein Q9R32_11710 [Actinotalea sp. AC32]|nr:hypothetical protein [Actinotalea sp. AC32]
MSLRHRAAALSAAALLTLLPALPASAATDGGGCSATSGVAVVVDSTALGGDLEVRCAPEAGGTGAEALELAGVEVTRDDASMVCAVGGLPDPCAEEFTGEYWAYWQAPADGEWTASMVGADEATTTDGGAEGWFWSDGTTPPQITPAEAVERAAAASAEQADEAAPAQDGADGSTAADDDASGTPTALLAGGAAALLVALVAGVVLVRRSAGRSTGTAPAAAREHADDRV